MKNFRRTWAEVDLSALAENYHTVRRCVGDGVKVMAVVKADAYGHGVERVAPLMQRCGADYFGVSCLQEAVELRKLGIQKPILILGYTDPAFFPYLFEYDLSQTVFEMDSALLLSKAAEQAGASAKVHCALDTGMGRIGFDGFDPQNAAAAILEVSRLPGILLEGLFTHFSVADTDGEERYTDQQFGRFMAVKALLNGEGLAPLCHVANSAGTFLDAKYHLDMVRAGIVLYGLEPGGRENPFKPAMVMKTTVSFVKDLPKGRSVSYGRRFKSASPMRVATLSAGYADGYPRNLSGLGFAMIHGHRAKILGAVCMDQMMVDVTDLPCKAGDEAVLMGGEIPYDALARELGTIHYELICGIGKRVPRTYSEKTEESK